MINMKKYLPFIVCVLCSVVLVFCVFFVAFPPFAFSGHVKYSIEEDNVLNIIFDDVLVGALYSLSLFFLIKFAWKKEDEIHPIAWLILAILEFLALGIFVAFYFGVFFDYVFIRINVARIITALAFVVVNFVLIRKFILVRKYFKELKDTPHEDPTIRKS
ncbi:hypothetical protein DYE49_03155 [Treponema rectale]|uniref:Uncharacterized protein n=1 Tax=Treponema rectale TaxID=744512 RepID=A0A7M1XJB6_9SPIR|nr:hypothetical protein DYE49_03155 [Treponema rectale]